MGVKMERNEPTWKRPCILSVIFVDRLQFSSELNKLVFGFILLRVYLLLSIIVIEHRFGKQGTVYYIQASKIYKHCCNHRQQTRLKTNNKTIQDQIIQLGHYWCKKTCSRRMSKVSATMSNYVTAPLSGRQYTTIIQLKRTILRNVCPWYSHI